MTHPLNKQRLVGGLLNYFHLLVFPFAVPPLFSLGLTSCSPTLPHTPSLSTLPFQSSLQLALPSMTVPFSISDAHSSVQDPEFWSSNLSECALNLGAPPGHLLFPLGHPLEPGIGMAHKELQGERTKGIQYLMVTSQQA